MWKNAAADNNGEKKDITFRYRQAVKAILPDGYRKTDLM
jgi:hypothetical protein